MGLKLLQVNSQIYIAIIRVKEIFKNLTFFVIIYVHRPFSFKNYLNIVPAILHREVLCVGHFRGNYIISFVYTIVSREFSPAFSEYLYRPCYSSEETVSFLNIKLFILQVMLREM